MERTYIPALRFRPLTTWYDSIIKWTIRESAFKSQLVEQTRVLEGQNVLDLGCGTGTLTLLMKARYPKAEVTGIDADPQILEMARTKSTGAAVQFQQAMSFALPFADESFDCVVSSLVFHHLTRENKLQTLQEVRRVLRPAGQLHIADFGRPQNLLLRSAFWLVQLFDGFESTQDNVAGLLPSLVCDAGFPAAHETAVFATMFGTIRLLQVQKP